MKNMNSKLAHEISSSVYDLVYYFKRATKNKLLLLFKTRSEFTDNLISQQVFQVKEQISSTNVFVIRIFFEVEECFEDNQKLCAKLDASDYRAKHINKVGCPSTIFLAVNVFLSGITDWCW